MKSILFAAVKTTFSMMLLGLLTPPCATANTKRICLSALLSQIHERPGSPITENRAQRTLDLVAARSQYIFLRSEISTLWKDLATSIPFPSIREVWYQESTQPSRHVRHQPILTAGRDDQTEPSAPSAPDEEILSRPPTDRVMWDRWLDEQMSKNALDLDTILTFWKSARPFVDLSLRNRIEDSIAHIEHYINKLSLSYLDVILHRARSKMQPASRDDEFQNAFLNLRHYIARYNPTIRKGSPANLLSHFRWYLFKYNLPGQQKSPLNPVRASVEDLEQLSVETDGDSPFVTREEVRILLNRLHGPFDERQRFVLIRNYGIGCPPESLEELSKKLGVTRERVRQIRNKALAALGHLLYTDLVDPLVALDMEARRSPQQDEFVANHINSLRAPENIDPEDFGQTVALLRSNPRLLLRLISKLGLSESTILRLYLGVDREGRLTRPRSVEDISVLLDTRIPSVRERLRSALLSVSFARRFP